MPGDVLKSNQRLCIYIYIYRFEHARTKNRISTKLKSTGLLVQILIMLRKENFLSKIKQLTTC